MKSKNDLLIYAVIGIVAFCAFANTLGHGFVYDDNRQILSNPLIQQSELYGTALTSDVWAFKGGTDIAASNYYRPTFVTWMIANWWLFASSASGWHLTTVLLHVGVCLLLFAFLLRMRCEKFTAAVIALLFAVHPVHVENVAWISGATDPLMSALLLISLILAQAYVETKRAKSSTGRATVYFLLSLATYLLALGAKEVALFCFPLYWLIFRDVDGSDKRSNYSGMTQTVPYFAAAVAFFIARVMVLGAMFIPVEDPVKGSYGFLSIPKVFIFYMRQIVIPISLGPAQPIRAAADIGLLALIVPMILSAVIIWGLWTIARRGELQTFGLALFFLTLLPVMNPANFGTEQLVHDRYLYLPLAGLLIVVVPAIARLVDGKERPALAMALVVAVLLGVKTIQYNRVWSDSESLWRYAVTIDPGSAHAWHNFGSSTTNPPESLDAFETSLAIKRNAVGFVGRARALIALGRSEEAVAAAREAIAVNPSEINAFSLFQAYEAEAFVLAKLGRLAEAETSLKVARQRLPIYYAALTERLAVVLYTLDRKAETLAELESVRDRARSEYLNDSKSVFLRLGMLYAEQGRKSDAKAALEEYLSSTVEVEDTALADERRRATELLRRVSSP